MAVNVRGRLSGTATVGRISFETASSNGINPAAAKHIVGRTLDADMYDPPDDPAFPFSFDTEGSSLQLNKSDSKSSEVAFVVDEILRAPYGVALRLNPEGAIPNGANVYVDALILKHRNQDKYTAIKSAKEWYEQDDFLGDLVDMILGFTMTGVALQSRSSNEAAEDVQVVGEDDANAINELKVEKARTSAEVQTFINDFSEQYNFRKVIFDLLKDKKLTDNMILYWRIDKTAATVTESSVPESYKDSAKLIPGLVAFNSLDPSEVDWNNSLGADILLVKIPHDLKMRIVKAIEQDRELSRFNGKNIDPNTGYGPFVTALLESGVQRRWIEAVKAGEDYVELKHEEGDYWIVCTKERLYYGLAKPSMSRIFVSLAIRQSLTDGEFTAAEMVKHFIMLIQQGESIKQGPLAGQRNNWIKPKDAKELKTRFSTTAKAMRVVTDHTVTIKFIVPPIEMFSHDRYVCCEGRILNWAGATSTIVTGEGGNYGSGFIGIKRLIASIQENRQDLSDMIEAFFDHPTISPSVPSTEQIDIVACFNEQVLKEPTQLLKEVELFLKEKIIDPRSSLQVMGYNPDTIRDNQRRAKIENKIDGSWDGYINSLNENINANAVDKGSNKSGSVINDGRPPNADTVQNAGTRLQSPSSGS